MVVVAFVFDSTYHKFDITGVGLGLLFCLWLEVKLVVPSFSVQKNSLSSLKVRDLRHTQRG